jgi:hypothetical protein
MALLFARIMEILDEPGDSPTRANWLAPAKIAAEASTASENPGLHPGPRG